MADPSILFLLGEICVDPVFFIQIFIYVHLAHIMDKIEVKISNPAFFKLLFKNFFHLIHVGKIVTGEFAGQIKTFSRITGKCLSHYRL